MGAVCDTPGEMGSNEESGTDAIDVGRCTSCGKVCTVMRTADGRLFAAGTDGTCAGCGGAEFTVLTA